MTSPQKDFRAILGGFSGMLVICVVGLLLFALGGIYPAARQIEQTKLEIADLKVTLQKHEELTPVYVMLRRHGERPSFETLPLPARNPLLVEGLSELPSLFEGLARDSGLQLVSATPQVRSLRDGHEALRVDTRVRGDYHNMRTLIMRLNELPYIERIETLSVELIESGKEMRLTLWLGIG